MSAWSARTLGEISDDIGGSIRTGPFGSQLHQSDYIQSLDGVPVIMPRDLIGGRVSEGTIARIGEDDAVRLSQHRLHESDIVYARRGDIGRRALIGPREAGWVCGTGCLRISLGSDTLDPRFLFYYLGLPSVTAWIENQAVGATMANLNTDILRSVRVTYPVLAKQRRIGSILSAYDDLIENNARRIAILEEMARSLYREWFVHFRFPGHESVRMVESDLGRIPAGWTIHPVSEVIEVNPKTKVPKDGEKPFVSMAGLSETAMLIEQIGQRSGNSGSKFKNGDTLFARITPCLENGKTGFVNFLDKDSDVAFGSTEFIVLRGRSLPPEYVYLLARSEELRDHAIKSMSGATGRQRVRESCFDDFHVARATDGLLNQFRELVDPLFRSIRILAAKNKKLVDTRDLLLPKLVSGEVDVSGIDDGIAA